MRVRSHLIAKALYAVWKSSIGDRAIGGFFRRVEAGTKEALRKAQHWTLDTAKRLDEEHPCPHCGRPTMLSELQQLKTYCYRCSHWGHEPIDEEEEQKS